MSGTMEGIDARLEHGTEARDATSTTHNEGQTRPSYDSASGTRDTMTRIDQDEYGTVSSMHTITRTLHQDEEGIEMNESQPPKPAMVIPKRDYSDLEVCTEIPQSYGDARGDKMPVIYDSSEKIHGFGGPGALLSPSLTDPVPAYPKPMSVRGSTLSSAPLMKDDVGGMEMKQRGAAQGGNRTGLFGTNRKTLPVIFIGLTAFLLILLATVLGVTLTMKVNQRTHSAGGAASAEHAILGTSRLAAVNWTDPYNGALRSAVFYQDSQDSIMVSLINSISNEWTQNNVTNAIMNSTGANRLDVLSGTPLAAVTNRYQVSLYYLTGQLDVSEIWTSDIVSGTWYAGSLASSLGALRALNGSSLSAYWQICTNCTGSLCVTFQQEDGSIQLANMTNNSWELAGDLLTTESGASTNATGLSVRPFTEDGGNGTFGTDPNALRLYSFDSAGLLEWSDGPATNFTWEDEVASTAFSTTAASDPTPELAAITYGDHGLTSTLVNYLGPDGTIMCYVHNGNNWTSGQPTVAGDSAGLTNFTAIATAQNMRVYGLNNGSIYEYLVDEQNPLSWSKITTVYSSAA